MQERERKSHFSYFRDLFDAHKLYSTCLNDKACAIIFPNCLKLLHLMLIFPLSTACVKRFFSLLHKTLLICINIFRDNTIIAYVITFSNKILNKLCNLMTNSFQLNTHLFCFFSEERFIPGSSRPDVFCKKGVLRNFANFIGKRLWHRCFLWILQNF